MISIRRRLIIGLLVALILLWSSAAAVFLVNTQNELDEVLDARLAASARMVQRLILRGDLSLPSGDAPASDINRLEAELPTEIACQLWTLDGDLLSLSDNVPIFGGGVQRDGFATRTVEGEAWRMFVLSDASTAVRVITAERISRRDALLEGMAMSVLGPLVLILPLIAGVVWLGVGRGLAPLHEVQRALRRRNIENLEPVPIERAPAEVAPLIHGLNELLHRLQGTIERERRFIGDAAHELRTPLAGIKANLQVAAASAGETHDKALREAESVLDRMTRLVNQMLELSRLEDADEFGGNESCDPWQLLHDVARELGFQASQRNVRLVLNEEGGPRRLQIPAASLNIAVRNLVENAILHSPVDARVTIDLRPDGIHVKDQGPGIPAEELERVTQRFYRASHSTPGTGLGLSIVAAIARRHGARLQLANGADQGLVASLLFS